MLDMSSFFFCSCKVEEMVTAQLLFHQKIQTMGATVLSVRLWIFLQTPHAVGHPPLRLGEPTVPKHGMNGNGTKVVKDRHSFAPHSPASTSYLYRAALSGFSL